MAFEQDSVQDIIKNNNGRISQLRLEIDRLTEKCGAVKDALCAKERSDGSFAINFDKLADKLGLEQCLVLRKAIDERWNISGEAGEKPRVKVKAVAA